MSARPGVAVDVTVPADGGEHPNRHAPRVSVHLRAYWPPLATDSEIEEALRLAIELARQRIAERRAE